MTNALALMLLISGSSSTAAAGLKPKAADAPTVSVSALPDSRPEIRTRFSRDRILRRRQSGRSLQRQSLRGGQQQAMDGLISLIQTNVAPDCWGFGGTGSSGGSGVEWGTVPALAGKTQKVLPS